MAESKVQEEKVARGKISEIRIVYENGVDVFSGDINIPPPNFTPNKAGGDGDEEEEDKKKRLSKQTVSMETLANGAEKATQAEAEAKALAAKNAADAAETGNKAAVGDANESIKAVQKVAGDMVEEGIPKVINSIVAKNRDVAIGQGNEEEEDKKKRLSKQTVSMETLANGAEKATQAEAEAKALAAKNAADAAETGNKAAVGDANESIKAVQKVAGDMVEEGIPKVINSIVAKNRDVAIGQGNEGDANNAQSNEGDANNAQSNEGDANNAQSNEGDANNAQSNMGFWKKMRKRVTGKGGSKRGGKKSRKPKSKRIRVRKTRRRKH